MRLIDADELIKDFREELEKLDFEKLSDNDKLIINTSAIALRDFVKRQPTAYNIDKVVEELKDQSFIDNQLNKVVDLDEAIEIIKSIKEGGKNG